jgi:enamine deaminase RidA (YjgF/YER057c/UK114 family)
MNRIRVVLPVAALILLVTLAAVGTPQVGPGVRYLNTPGRTDNNPYANLVDTGDVVYLAGAIGVDPETNAPPADVEEEIRIVMESMKTRLEMVGLTMNDLVSVQVYCPDLTLYDQFNAVYRTYFTDHFPARAFIGSGPLLRGGRFEILGTAVRR